MFSNSNDSLTLKPNSQYNRLLVNNNQVAYVSDIPYPQLSSNSADGTYVLKATKLNDTITYNWVQET